MDQFNVPESLLLEIACFNQESAINAANGGADRIELCKDYESGGLSPDAATLMALKSQLSIPIYAIIRPHSNGFCYDSESFETMKATLSLLKTLGADGFVFGILGPVVQGESLDTYSCIDIARNKELVRLADDRPCTFHRAFDCIPESQWDAALADIAKCGFSSILTSGGPSRDKAIDCAEKLTDLTRRLDSLRSRVPEVFELPRIIIGGGVRSNNVRLLWEKSHASAFHSSALVSSSEIVAKDEVEKLKDRLRNVTCTN
ncbi:hypothetical protein N7510_009449 [Penicillium lagena]|uniref:uncharacterized protein n=1 Tax=Penicillium lagena TaxID=94218 RepID=UPI0025416EA0|nr:uncharacterized protein N7510_009449 [Penicillium lagena]KAJ5606668.1 hypothetical protein N7510_009449 [Penicillium lagena]